MIAHTVDMTDPQAIRGMAKAPEKSEDNPAVLMLVRELIIGDTPRISGENAEHLLALAAVEDELPPIIVHHPTMRVIDGVHRLRVAQSRNDERILARYFHGTEAEVFVLAVRSNIAHGLPLSLTDRRAAAARIIQSHRGWSDRMVASVTGLAAGTVAGIRVMGGGASEDGANQDRPGQDRARIGLDGRVRPLDGPERRMHAARLITENPGITLRQVSQAAGISPETARDVRNRLQQGEDPVRARAGSKDTGTQVWPERQKTSSPTVIGGLAMAQAVERLKADPALRFSENGRILLRLLHAHLLEADDWEKIGENIPPHCSGVIAELADRCARMWQVLAENLERKSADIA